MNESFLKEVSKCTGLLYFVQFIPNHYLFLPNLDYLHNALLPIRIAIHQAIQETLKAKHQNVLNVGYKLFSTSEPEAFFPNNAVNHLLTHFTEIPLEYLMSGVILYVNGGKMMQVAGAPISECIYGFYYRELIDNSVRSKPLISRIPMLYRRARQGRNERVLFQRVFDLSGLDSLNLDKIAISDVKMRLSKLRIEKLLDYYCPRRAETQFACNLSFGKCNFNKKYDCAEQPHSLVVRFLFRVFVKVCRPLITDLRQWKRKITSLVTMRRNEKLPLNVENLSIKSVKWATPKASKAVSLQKQKEFHIFYSIIMEKLLIPIVQLCFYVTEGCQTKNLLLYYRHDDWLAITRPYRSHLEKSMLEPKEKKTDRLKGLQGCSKLRLVPKKNGFRPIMNLRKDNLNSQLRYVYAVLSYYRIQFPRLLGFSALGFDQVIARMESFVNRVPGPYNFSKFDVQACYDNIPNQRMLSILKEIVSHDAFYLQRVDRVRLNGEGKLIRKAELVAFPIGQSHKPTQKRGCLSILDRGMPKTISKKEVMDTLEAHLLYNMIEFDGRIWRQKHGIPQGSILSSTLCALFYGYLDRRVFREYLKKCNLLVVRFVDDVLISSPDKELVASFVRDVSECKQEGLLVHKVAYSQINEPFFWCGMLINPIDFSIKPESSFESIRNGLNLDYSLPVIQIIQKQLLAHLRYRLQPIFLNPRFPVDLIKETTQDTHAIMRKRCFIAAKELKKHLGREIRGKLLEELLLDIQKLILKKTNNLLVASKNKSTSRNPYHQKHFGKLPIKDIESLN